jgi:hypothetical protein
MEHYSGDISVSFGFHGYADFNRGLARTNWSDVQLKLENTASHHMIDGQVSY